MPPLAIFSLAFSLVSFLPNHNSPSIRVADNYTLWLSDTTLSVRPDDGSTVSMEFPATRRVTSPDGLSIKYPKVFPNVDLVVYGNRGGFEYDWRLGPGADASAISLSFRGARYETIAPDGDLILYTSTGRVRHGRPFAYQQVDGHRQTVWRPHSIWPKMAASASGSAITTRPGPWLSTRRFLS
jgi:hypothetical protein